MGVCNPAECRRLRNRETGVNTRLVFATQFHAFGTSHFAALAVAALVAIVMFAARSRCLELVLATAVFASEPLSVLAHWLAGDLMLNNGLPLHLCDVAAIAGALALWKKIPLACELVYFFGLAGTLQGLITPNLLEDFPSPRFCVFFLNHCGIVITAIYVVGAMGMRPRAGAAARMLGCILCYALVVGLINAALHTNYGFLCAKPPVASLIDALGPWPWYIGGMIGLAATFFMILDLPFAWRRR